ncbi:armadillo repeat-containing protein 1-like [Lampetra fluviatilis]
MVDSPDPCEVAARLRELASDPRLRAAVAREHGGCLPGLVMLLDQPGPEVVTTALQALRYLAECVDSRGRMMSELGLMVSLQHIADRTDFPPETRSLATEIYDLLSRWDGAEEEPPPTSPPPPVGRGGGGAAVVRAPPPRGRWGSARRRRRGPRGAARARPFLGSTNKRARTVTLHIEGLTDVERRARCEEVLLTVRGVISFTFQMHAQRCIVRMRADLKPECLATAIATTQLMAAQQVVKNEAGEEILAPLSSGPSAGGGSAPGFPDYLPEDEDEEGEATPREAVSRGGGVSRGRGGLAQLRRQLLLEVLLLVMPPVAGGRWSRGQGAGRGGPSHREDGAVHGSISTRAAHHVEYTLRAAASGWHAPPGGPVAPSGRSRPGLAVESAAPPPLPPVHPPDCAGIRTFA